jgi:hypothetical protein
MPALHELESRIRSIALRSKNFKIGETSQSLEERASGYSEYSHIIEITRSKYKKDIDYYEEKMLEVFLSWANCDNRNYGSANRMPTRPLYRLYVVFNPKPNTRF